MFLGIKSIDKNVFFNKQDAIIIDRLKSNIW